MDVVIERCAGLDVHKKTVTAWSYPGGVLACGVLALCGFRGKRCECGGSGL